MVASRVVGDAAFPCTELETWLFVVAAGAVGDAAFPHTELETWPVVDVVVVVFVPVVAFVPAVASVPVGDAAIPYAEPETGLFVGTAHLRHFDSFAP